VKNKFLIHTLFVALAFVGLSGCSGNAGSSSNSGGGGSTGTGTGTGTADSKLNGTFTYYLNGLDSSAAPYSVVGTVTLNGSGGVTSGEQDLFDSASTTVDTADVITGGSYSVNSNSTGTITIDTTNEGNETLSLFVVNSNHVLINEFDSSATSSGSMDMQTATSGVPAGGYSFAAIDLADDFIIGGVLTSDGSASFTTGTGDVAEVQTASGTSQIVVANNQALTGSFSVPDSFGRGTIIINEPSVGSLQFAYYAVGPEVFRMIEIDATTALAAGSMYSQGTTTSNLSAASLSGNFVFDEFGIANTSIGDIAAAGKFTTDGSAVVTSGVVDVNDGSGSIVTASPIAGTYTVTPAGYGAITLTTTATDLTNLGVYPVDPTLNIADPNNTTGGGGALMTEYDTTALAVGVVVPQTSTGIISGSYGVDVQAQTGSSTSADETDFVGSMNAASGGKLSGVLNLNDLTVGTSSNLAYSGTVTLDGNNPGRLVFATKTSAGTLVDATGYESSPTQVFLVDTDTNEVGVGVVQNQ
jgi:hypothetical protein